MVTSLLTLAHRGSSCLHFENARAHESRSHAWTPPRDGWRHHIVSSCERPSIHHSPYMLHPTSYILHPTPYIALHIVVVVASTDAAYVQRFKHKARRPRPARFTPARILLSYSISRGTPIHRPSDTSSFRPPFSICARKWSWISTIRLTLTPTPSPIWSSPARLVLRSSSLSVWQRSLTSSPPYDTIRYETAPVFSFPRRPSSVFVRAP